MQSSILAHETQVFVVDAIVSKYVLASRHVQCIAFVCMWQVGRQLRDYRRAESDIGLLGDKIKKKDSFLAAA